MALRVDQKIPSFELPDAATGVSFESRSLAGSDALILFLRGTWCPYCREQLRNLSDRFPILEKAGIRVVAISCQSEASLRAYVNSNPLPFPLLADSSRLVARAFGVHYWLRWDGFHLAHPSLFIVDRSGTITFAHVGKTMSDLPVGLILDRFTAILASPSAEQPA